jgi:hypothetical protein
MSSKEAVAKNVIHGIFYLANLLRLRILSARISFLLTPTVALVFVTRLLFLPTSLQNQ